LSSLLPQPLLLLLVVAAAAFTTKGIAEKPSEEKIVIQAFGKAESRAPSDAVDAGIA
jgi:hypothetical protein